MLPSEIKITSNLTFLLTLYRKLLSFLKYCSRCLLHAIEIELHIMKVIGEREARMQEFVDLYHCSIINHRFNAAYKHV